MIFKMVDQKQRLSSKTSKLNRHGSTINQGLICRTPAHVRGYVLNNQDTLWLMIASIHKHIESNVQNKDDKGYYWILPDIWKVSIMQADKYLQSNGWRGLSEDRIVSQSILWITWSTRIEQILKKCEELFIGYSCGKELQGSKHKGFSEHQRVFQDIL